ncbi:MAG: ATP-binding protein, partial [Selenomonas sp.]|nr:ATP-binding protein [Selenomonas sp.]
MVEGTRIEFKREYAETIRKTVIAFANTEGGKIYIGIDDDGCIIGVDDPDDVQKKVVSSCRDGIAPDVMQFLSCDRKTMDGKDVIVVDVQRGTSCPYYLQHKGIRPEGVYVRRGSASIPASQAEILHMIRVTGDAHYE